MHGRWTANPKMKERGEHVQLAIQLKSKSCSKQMEIGNDKSFWKVTWWLAKGALCSLGKEIRTQKCVTNNIDEVIIEICILFLP